MTKPDYSCLDTAHLDEVIKYEAELNKVSTVKGIDNFYCLLPKHLKDDVYFITLVVNRKKRIIEKE